MFPLDQTYTNFNKKCWYDNNKIKRPMTIFPSPN